MIKTDVVELSALILRFGENLIFLWMQFVDLNI